MFDRLKISDKVLYRFLMSILEEDRDLRFDDSYLTDYHNNTQNLLSCLLYGFLRDLENRNLFYKTFNQKQSIASEVIHGTIDVQKTFYESIWMEDKVYSHTDVLDVSKSFYTMIGTAQVLAYSLSIEHTEFWSHCVKHYKKLYHIDISKIDMNNINYQYYLDLCDSYLSVSALQSYHTLVKLCKFIFELFTIYNTDMRYKDNLVNLDCSTEYIIQQFFIAEFRREMRRRISIKNSTLKGYSCSLADASRTIRDYTNNPFIGKLQADGVFTLSKGKEKNYVVVFDVKTNLPLKKKIKDTDIEEESDKVLYAARRNTSQLYQYLGEYIYHNKFDSVFGCLVHFCFNTDYYNKFHKKRNYDNNFSEAYKYGAFVFNFTDDYDEKEIRAKVSELFDFLEIEKYTS